MDVCEYFLDVGAEESFPERKNSPFLIAVMNGHFEICKLMIDRTEDKNRQNSEGQTLLHICASCKSRRVLKRGLDL